MKKCVQVSLYVISLMLWYTRCRIIRLPCKIEGAFDVAEKDRVLVNNTIGSYTVTDVQQCFEKCNNDHSDCKSVNHRQFGSNNCQLSSKIKDETNGSDFIRMDHWTYYSTDHSKRNVGSYCEAFTPCNSTSLCFDTCGCPGYHCMDECKDDYFRIKALQCLIANVALKKPALISSLYDEKTVASNAVDGNLYSRHSTCAITQASYTAPWLLVDLQADYNILYVRIKNRKREASLTVSQPFDVRVGNSNETGGVLNDYCVKQGRIPTVDTLMRFNCTQGTRGRYISFHTPAITSYLELCELEAYGIEPKYCKTCNCC